MRGKQLTLIKVFDKKPPVTIPYEEARARIAQYLMNQKVQRQLNQYVDELKKKATIKRFVGGNPWECDPSMEREQNEEALDYTK